MNRNGHRGADKLSHTQLTALVWAGVLAPAAELLPALTLPVAGKGAWLAPVAAIPLVLLGGWALGTLAGGQGLAVSLRAFPGRWLGMPFLIIYMVWAQVLLSVRLRLCARRLLASGYRDGALWFFLLAVAALIWWIGRGRLSAFARSAQLSLTVLLVTGGVVLLLSLPKAEPERVLPLWRTDVVPVLWSALPAAGALGWGLFGAFLTEALEPRPSKGRWYGRFWGVGVCVFLALSQWIILASLGAALTGRLDDPFFTLAKSVGVEGAFQRVESVIVALWTLADVSMGALLLFAQRAVWRELWPRAREERVASVSLILAAALALAVFSNNTAEEWGRRVIPAGNLLLGLILPLLLLFVRELFSEKDTKEQHFVHKKEVKGQDIVVEKDVEKKGEKGKKRC